MKTNQEAKNSFLDTRQDFDNDYEVVPEANFQAASLEPSDGVPGTGNDGDHADISQHIGLARWTAATAKRLFRASGEMKGGEMLIHIHTHERCLYRFATDFKIYRCFIFSTRPTG